MTEIEQPVIRIRLYREGGRYVESANKKGYTEKGADTWNRPIKKGYTEKGADTWN
jgi:hypothetical protein